MASCEKQADCTAQEVCSDGECIPVETPEPRKVRRTFTTARAEYGGKLADEQRMIESFGDFLNDQLEEATEKRAEQQESTGFWGTVGSIVGFGLGCMFGGAGGCLKGGVLGASIGSFGGRGAADYFNDAESYGLTEDEFAKLDPDQLVFLQSTYSDLIDDARDMQDDLDKYDANEWKQHVLGIIGDTWNAYKMAGFGETLWEGGKSLFGKASDGEQALSDLSKHSTDIMKEADDAVDITTGLPEGTLLNQPLSRTFWQPQQSGPSIYPAETFTEGKI